MASRLFALDGAEVVEVDEGPGGGRMVWLVTAGPAARVCPGCQAAPGHVRGRVVRSPADMGYGQGRVSVLWVKRRRECRVPSCPRQAFTESLPAIPARCRVTRRLGDHAGWLVAEGGRAVTAAARECGCHGRWRMPRSRGVRTRCLGSRPRRWRARGPVSTGAAGPGSLAAPARASTRCWRTGGTPASWTCPGIRG